MTQKILILIGLILISLPYSSEAQEINCRDDLEVVPATLISSNSFYAESPLLKDNKLYSVEFSQDRVMLHNQGLSSSFWTESGCGPAAVTTYLDGFLVACYSASKLVELSSEGNWIRNIETAADGVTRLLTPNDFTHDKSGGVYFTSSGEFNASQETKIEGKIYYLNSHRTASLVASNIHYSNGIAMTPDGKSLLVSEHLENRILRYTIESPGILFPEFSIFSALMKSFSLPDTPASPYLGPDGIRMTSDGVLFVAQYAGSRILKLNSDGNPIGTIRLKSKYINTTNIWIDHSDLYLSAVQDDTDILGKNAKYPSIIAKISDPKLLTRADLICEINEDH